MIRRGEGQPSQNEPSRDDAFSRAIIAEKDPFARGYMENLRAQIATIAAKHGANARDVWDRAVQDRMSVDELDAVNDLFARIKAMSERKVSRAEERRILEDVEKLEHEATEMLQEVVSDHLATEIVEAFLSEGLVDDAVLYAMRFFSVEGAKIPPALNVRLEIARAAEIVRKDSDSRFTREDAAQVLLQAVRFLYGDRTGATDSLSTLERNRLFLAAYDGFLSLREDKQIESEMDSTLGWAGLYRTVAVECLAIEARRRGLAEPAKFIEVLRSVEGDEVPDEKIEDYLREQLVVAEMFHRRGLDPAPAIVRVGRAFRQAVRVLFDPMKPRAVSRNTMRDEIIQTLGRIDRPDLLVSGLGPAELERIGDTKIIPLTHGYIDAGAFDAAETLLAQEKNWITRAICGQTFVTKLLEARNIPMAQRIHDEYVSDESSEEIQFARLAERARRGENVFDEVRGGDDRAIAKAAIATIGYTVGMRKRIAEYVAKR